MERRVNRNSGFNTSGQILKGAGARENPTPNNQSVPTSKDSEAKTPEQEGQLWEMCRQQGMDRRRFVQLLSAGGGVAVLAAGTALALEPTRTPSIPTPRPNQAPEASPWFKDMTPFIKHGNKNLETRLENLGGFLTPNELFFVRNNSTSIQVDVNSYRLEVEGDAIEKPLSLTYEQILNLPSRTLSAYIECGGNQRAFFAILMDQPARGTQWKAGGISMAMWTGVPLWEVLSLAKVKDNAVAVQFIGLDVDSPEQEFRRPIPIEKAMDPDSLLAYRMNGAVLPPDHGFPLRTVIPGWVGSTSIKWLGKMVVSSQKIWSRNNTVSYVLVGDAYPAEGKAKGKVITLQSIKSALALPWPARLHPGPQVVRGYAHSPHAAIAKVEWSVDDGRTWLTARVLDPLIPYAWARFEFEWNATRGEHAITTRATDRAGNTQPDKIPFNEKGYLFNLPLSHPVTVTQPGA